MNENVNIACGECEKLARGAKLKEHVLETRFQIFARAVALT